jgi:hypothetical protein
MLGFLIDIIFAVFTRLSMKGSIPVQNSDWHTGTMHTGLDVAVGLKTAVTPPFCPLIAQAAGRGAVSLVPV